MLSEIQVRVQWLRQIGVAQKEIKKHRLNKPMSDLAFRAVVSHLLKRRMPKGGFHELGSATANKK